jgi:DNA-binding winged helix-turn-helix (wHTH) protein
MARGAHKVDVDARPSDRRQSLNPLEAVTPGTGVLQYSISFGHFRLLPIQRLLWNGDRPVHLGSRAFDILVVLVERAGELVTKRELMRVVWPDTIVVEANLTVHVTALRRALGDDQADNRYIVNIPGRGYRFVAPVTVADQPTSLASSPQTAVDRGQSVQPIGPGAAFDRPRRGRRYRRAIAAEPAAAFDRRVGCRRQHRRRLRCGRRAGPGGGTRSMAARPGTDFSGVGLGGGPQAQSLIPPAA